MTPPSEREETATVPGAVQHRLELLMEANGAILAGRSVEDVLQRIVRSARELVAARQAVVEVVRDDGSVAQVASDGPGGLGPPSTPPSAQLLEVRITAQGSVFGVLRLTGREGGSGFDEEDVATVRALAVTAGVAVENARLFATSRRREQWAAAAAQVSSSLLDPAPGTDPVELVADTVLRLTAADVVSLVVPTGRATFRVRLARGERAVELEGLEYDAPTTIAEEALATGRGVRVALLPEQPRFTVHVQRLFDVGAALALPLHGAERTHGVLVVARRSGRPVFDPTDLELSESFAAQAAIALELAAARADQQRLALLEDRERIARDLHDHVIQRLFAAGLSLEGIARSAGGDTAARLGSVADDLDAVIRQIRTLIFRLQPPGASPSVRSVVLEEAQRAAAVLGVEPEVTTTGPVDTVADPDLVEDVAAVAREALSNVVRHAAARHVGVTVTATAHELRVVVSDDGRGPGETARRSGLRNLDQRARRHGGRCELVAPASGGAELQWSIPLA